MLKLIHFSLSKISLLKIIIVAVVIMFFHVANVSGQTINPSSSIRTMLPDKLADNWRATSKSQSLTADQCSVLPDGDIYLEYGLETLTTRHYTNGKIKIAIEVFQMQFASGAYGLFTFNRNNLPETRREFRIGRYLISVLSENEKIPPYELIFRSLQTLFSNEGELPVLPSHLPKQNLIPDSEKYLIGPKTLSKMEEFVELKDVIKFDGGTEAVAAVYDNAGSRMNLIIIEYHTPQLATDGKNQFQNYFGKLTEKERNQRLIKRIGNYIVLAINIRDLASAENLLGQIKYNPKVYWEGDRLSDIPLAFRPPDPIAIEEASQTAFMLIRTFYWIGVMLLGAIFFGVITGGSYFYWKRYRLRKMGLDDIFSDAGGTVRLNLDGYLLQPVNSALSNIETEKEK